MLLNESYNYFSGITLFILERPLVAYQSATLSCMTDLPVTSIEWRNQSSQLTTITSDDDANLTVLEYTIPLVTLDLHGEAFTCVITAGDTTYFKAFYIQIEGTIPFVLLFC